MLDVRRTPCSASTSTQRRRGHRVPAEPGRVECGRARRGRRRRCCPPDPAIARRLDRRPRTCERSRRRALGCPTRSGRAARARRVTRRCSPPATPTTASPAHGCRHELLLALSRAHPLVRRARRRERRRDRPRRPRGPRPRADRDRHPRRDGRRSGVGAAARRRVVAALGHVRAVAGRDALSVDAHLWVRELTRIDRAADADRTLPLGRRRATRCRRRRRGRAAVVPGDLLPPLRPLRLGRRARTGRRQPRRRRRRRSAATTPAGEGRFRPLLHAAAEAEDVYAGGARGRRAGLVLRAQPRAAHRHRPTTTTPTCATAGSCRCSPAPGRTPTRTPATTPALPAGRPTASASSAAPSPRCCRCRCPRCSDRRGSRRGRRRRWSSPTRCRTPRTGPGSSRPVRTRSPCARCCATPSQDGPLALDQLVDEVIRLAGERPVRPYRLLAPDCADRESFAPVLDDDRPCAVCRRACASRVRKRLALDAALEFGLNSRTGRTLELTGTVAVEVEAGPAGEDGKRGPRGAAGFACQTTIDGELPDDATLVRWVRGVLDRMRAQGAIDHPWFDKYRREDGNRWSITGGRPRRTACPPSREAAPPRLPAGRRRWRRQGREAAGRGHRRRSPGTRAGPSRALTSARTTVAGLRGCCSNGWPTTACSPPPPASPAPPCTRSRPRVSSSRRPSRGSDRRPAPARLRHLPGRHHRHAHHRRAARRRAVPARALPRRLCSRPRSADNFYRQPVRLARHAPRRRPRTHQPARRRDPAGLRGRVQGRRHQPAGTERAGRDAHAGDGHRHRRPLRGVPVVAAPHRRRPTCSGSAAPGASPATPSTSPIVTGRGEQLPKLGDPLSVINGEVRPPATYLQAEEILRRQYTAHLVDEFARDHQRAAPAQCRAARSGPASPARSSATSSPTPKPLADDHVDRFAATFDELPEPIVDALRDVAPPRRRPRHQRVRRARCTGPAGAGSTPSRR